MGINIQIYHGIKILCQVIPLRESHINLQGTAMTDRSTDVGYEQGKCHRISEHGVVMAETAMESKGNMIKLKYPT